MTQADLFASVCPNCKGEGKRLLSFAVRRSSGIRVRVVPHADELKYGDLIVLPPTGRRRSAIWDTHKLVYRQAKRRGSRADDFEYTPCGRCRGTGYLKLEWERVYRRFLIWRGVQRASF